MNVEQRLIEVFQTSAHVEPTPDLFSRVLHSIEEDRRHRRRVLETTAAAVVVFAALVSVGVMSMQDGPGRRQGFVHRPTMEILEWVALLALLVVLGPAIRRFGRGYVADLWPRDSAVPGPLLRLMDVAFYLVGVGYVMVPAQFEFGPELIADRWPDQLSGAAFRIGGMLLVFGILHATTLVLLPVVALVGNATRRGAPVPRWVMLLAVLVGLGTVLPLQLAFGLGIWGS